MCCEDEEVHYRSFAYTCRCARRYELQLEFQPFATAAQVAAHDFVCACGHVHASLPGKVVSWQEIR